MHLRAANNAPERANAAVTTDVLQELAEVDLTALYRRAFRLTHDHEAAQDLAQDTLERAQRKLALYQPGTDMRAWLACIMRNLWISHHRRQAGAPPVVPLDEIEPAIPHQLRDGAAPASGVEASVIDEMSAAAICLAIEGLPPFLRQVVVLADVEETPYWAIAARLAIPLGTVSSRLSRGRRRVRQLLLDQDRDDAYLARAS